MKEYLFFNSMITPRLITFVYWIKLLVVCIVGLRLMLSGVEGFFAGIIFVIVGFLVVRIVCELLILTFKIHENVRKIAERES